MSSADDPAAALAVGWWKGGWWKVGVGYLDGGSSASSWWLKLQPTHLKKYAQVKMGENLPQISG